MTTTPDETCRELANKKSTENVHKGKTKVFSKPKSAMTVINPRYFFIRENSGSHLTDLDFTTSNIMQAIN